MLSSAYRPQCNNFDKCKVHYTICYKNIREIISYKFREIYPYTFTSHICKIIQIIDRIHNNIDIMLPHSALSLHFDFNFNFLIFFLVIKK